MQVEGKVDSTYTKTINTRNGDASVYHTVLDSGDDINCGFRDPKHVQGAYVTLNVEQSPYGLKLSTKGGGRGNAPSKGNFPSANTATPMAKQSPRQVEFPVPKNTKGITIARQNSGGHAAQIVSALVNQGVIKDKDEAIDAFFDLAYDITDFATGHREENIAKSMQVMEDE